VDYSREEYLICVLARMLEGLRNVAVGAASPIPGCAALLIQAESQGRTRAMIRHADEDGVEQAPLCGRRKPAEVQEHDRVRKSGFPHQRADRAAADPDIGGIRRGDGRAPGSHERPIIQTAPPGTALLPYRHRYEIGLGRC